MRLVVAAILITSWCVPAFAQEDAEARARAHYEIAQGLYRLGDYRGAIKEFAAGYELVKKPRFLLNIGTMYRKLGELSHARDMYRQFLDTAAADDPQRVQAQDVLREIEEQLRNNPVPEPSPTPTPNPSPPTVTPAPASAVTETPPPRKPRKALIGAGVALSVFGVLSLGGGIASGVLASSTANDLSNLDKMGGVFDPGKDSLYTTERTLEGVFLGVGAAATVTGIVLIVIGRR